MGELVFGIYAVITALGIVGVFKILPKKKQREILTYIESLDK